MAMLFDRGFWNRGRAFGDSGDAVPIGQDELFDGWALADLEPELLGMLKRIGRLSVGEIEAEFDHETTLLNMRALVTDAPPGGFWRSRNRQLIIRWVEWARRRGLVVSDAQTIDAWGKPLAAPEWMLTAAGQRRLGAIESQRSFLPRAVRDNAVQTAIEGLKNAVKTVIAGGPLVLIAWGAGLLKHPSPLGLVLASTMFVAAVIAALTRRAAVSWAYRPGAARFARAMNDAKDEYEKISSVQLRKLRRIERDIARHRRRRPSRKEIWGEAVSAELQLMKDAIAAERSVNQPDDLS